MLVFGRPKRMENILSDLHIDCWWTRLLIYLIYSPKAAGALFEKYKFQPSLNSFLGEHVEIVSLPSWDCKKKSIDCSILCVLCEKGLENCFYVFVGCELSQQCWRETYLWYQISFEMPNCDSFQKLCFSILQNLDGKDGACFAMIMCNTWYARNPMLEDFGM